MYLNEEERQLLHKALVIYHRQLFVYAGPEAERERLRALMARLQGKDPLVYGADKPLNIKHWIHAGELDTAHIETTADVYEQAIILMDGACSYDIVGRPLFEGADGNYYVGELGFGIMPADPDFVNDQLEEIDAGIQTEKA